MRTCFPDVLIHTSYKEGLHRSIFGSINKPCIIIWLKWNETNSCNLLISCQLQERVENNGSIHLIFRSNKLLGFENWTYFHIILKILLHYLILISKPKCLGFLPIILILYLEPKFSTHDVHYMSLWLVQSGHSWILQILIHLSRQSLWPTFLHLCLKNLLLNIITKVIQKHNSALGKVKQKEQSSC